MEAAINGVMQVLSYPVDMDAKVVSLKTGEPKTAVNEPNEAPQVKRLIDALIRLASLLKELQTQSHLVHLNYEGVNFLEVHAFLKEQYEAHLEQFDTVAEFVRSMDHFMPMCACGLKDLMPEFHNIESYDGRSQLLTYYMNIESLGYMAKEVEALAARTGAPDVQNYMADLVGSAFKTSWFLKAMLRGC